MDADERSQRRAVPPSYVWRVTYWAARRGWLRDDRVPAAVLQLLPKGEVCYPDGFLSIPLTLGTAHEYAGAYGGQVRPPSPRKLQERGANVTIGAANRKCG